MINEKILEGIKTKETEDKYKSITFSVALDRDKPIPKDHKCQMVKIDAQNIKCQKCHKGYAGPQIDKLLQLINS